MPKRTNSLPRLCRDKTNNRAVVYLNGRKVSVAPWGSNPRKPSKATQQEYDRLITRWIANGRQLAPPKPGSDEENTLSINELIVAYWNHVQSYYRDPEGKPTSEVDNIRQGMRPLKRLFGHAQAVEFGPLALEGVRRLMIGDGLARRTINNHVDRINGFSSGRPSRSSCPVRSTAPFGPSTGCGKDAVTRRKPNRSSPCPTLTSTRCFPTYCRPSLR